MPTRSLNVQITADDRDFQKALRRSGDSVGRFGRETSLHARLATSGFRGVGVAARGMSAGVGAAAVGVGFLTKQFVESEKVGKQTTAVLKSTGGAAHVTAKQVSDLATAISRKTGVDDEAIQSGENLLLTFTNIRNEAGRGNKIFNQSTRVITDMSAALGQDMKSSAIQVGKALNDPIKGVTALQRVGVSFTAKQKEQIKTLVESGKTLDAQKLILRELNKEFGGAAAAKATPFDRLKVSAGNLAETLGGRLAPILGRASAATNKFLIGLQDGTGAGGRFGRTIKNVADTVSGAWRTAVTAARRFLNSHQEDIESVRKTMRNLGVAARFVFTEILLPVIKRAVSAVLPILKGMAQAVQGMVRLITGVLTGDWRRAWRGAKDLVVGVLKATVGVVRGTASVLFEAAKRVGGAILKGVVAGLKGLAGAIKDAVINGIKSGVNAAKGAAGDIIGKINPFGDGIGKAAKNIAGDGFGLGLGPLGSGGPFGGLHGADSRMGVFAGIASRFGLRVTSGKDDHSTMTSSGNLSYHATGEALDFSNGYETPQEMAFAKFMSSRFGGRLAELIYTPLGYSIKDGRKVPPIAAGDHHDHVHVAFDLGRPGPGIGDGIGRRPRTGDGRGKFTATSYGPPWGGIQGGGVTATGVNLKNSPHIYGIAVDPNRLRLGKNYYVWPNPFGRRGPFRAFDTGGAIKGNRIDFYDWRGRRSQNAWGSRTVTISDDPALNSSGGHSRSPGARAMTPAQSNAQSQFRSSRAEGRATEGAAITDAGLVGPGQGGYEIQLSDAQLAEAGARASDNLPGLIKALQRELKLKRRRLKRIRRALKKRLRSETRKRLTDEAATLIGEIAELRSTLKEYNADAAGGATTISAAESLDAGVAPEGQMLTADGTAVVDAPEAPTPLDFLNRDVATAALTPGLDDDIKAAGAIVDYWQNQLRIAQGTPDPRDDTEAASNLAAANDALKALTDSVDQANLLAQQRMDLDKELARNQQLLLGLAKQGPEIVAAVVAAVNGQIGGKVGLGFQTPGYAGQTARY